MVWRNSRRLSSKGAAAGGEFAEEEFAPSRGLWELLSEPSAPARVAGRDGIPSHLGKRERKINFFPWELPARRDKSVKTPRDALLGWGFSGSYCFWQPKTKSAF